MTMSRDADRGELNSDQVGSPYLLTCGSSLTKMENDEFCLSIHPV
jgi:hypothetical protein